MPAEETVIDDLRIRLNQKGARDFLKLSVPRRHGRYHEIQTPRCLYQFNLNAEIKYVQGRHRDWPHPAEWLKRTPGNDWIYYSVGSYNDVFDLVGEYYFPCSLHEPNPFIKHSPMISRSVQEALLDMEPLLEKLSALSSRDNLPPSLIAFLHQAAALNPEALKRRRVDFHRILGENITVLPPDTRHVDYAVIPVIMARGCRYHCGFCRFKSRSPFSALTRSEIRQQMLMMKEYLSIDLHNYNAVFLGQHDALLAGTDCVSFSAETAYETFELDRSYMKESWLFLFGSVDAMLDAEESLFEALNQLPYRSYINLGLESLDAVTLNGLQKPINPVKVKEAFLRMLDVNRRYPHIEVTANFVLGKGLPDSHLPSLIEHLNCTASQSTSKGALYLSILDSKESKPEILSCFFALKRTSRIPVYLYLVQRL